MINEVGLTRLWWIPLIVGIVCIAFGIWCFVDPTDSIEVMAYCFCIAMVIAGVMDISFAIINARANLNWGWSLALGLIELACGIWLLSVPAPTLAGAFVFATGFWIIIVCINSICESAAMSRYLGGASVVWMILLLIATIVLGFVFLSNPLAGAVAVWFWLGLSLLMYGCYRIAFAFQLRDINRRLNI